MLNVLAYCSTEESIFLTDPRDITVEILSKLVADITINAVDEVKDKYLQ